MEREPVSSSNIASIGYDEDSAEMEIEFNSGGVWRYPVSKETSDQIKNAASVGGEFHRLIRKAGITGSRV